MVYWMKVIISPAEFFGGQVEYGQDVEFLSFCVSTVYAAGKQGVVF